MAKCSVFHDDSLFGHKLIDKRPKGSVQIQFDELGSPQKSIQIEWDADEACIRVRTNDGGTVLNIVPEAGNVVRVVPVLFGNSPIRSLYEQKELEE